MNNDIQNLIHDYTTYSMWAAGDWQHVEQYGQAFIGLTVATPKNLPPLREEENALHSWREAMHRWRNSSKKLAEVSTALQALGVDVTQLPTEREPAGNLDDEENRKARQNVLYLRNSPKFKTRW